MHVINLGKNKNKTKKEKYAKMNRQFTKEETQMMKI